MIQCKHLSSTNLPLDEQQPDDKVRLHTTSRCQLEQGHAGEHQMAVVKAWQMTDVAVEGSK